MHTSTSAALTFSPADIAALRGIQKAIARRLQACHIDLEIAEADEGGELSASFAGEDGLALATIVLRHEGVRPVFGLMSSHSDDRAPTASVGDLTGPAKRAAIAAFQDSPAGMRLKAKRAGATCKRKA